MLGTDANEIVIAAAKPLRDNAGPAEHAFVDAFNTHMLSLFSEHQAVAENERKGRLGNGRPRCRCMWSGRLFTGRGANLRARPDQ